MTKQNFVELESQIEKVIKKNRADMREKVSQLSNGTLEEDDFLIYLITEFTRIQSEISGYARIFVKRFKHINSKELIEDNITKAAIIETLFDLMPKNNKPSIIQGKFQKNSQRSDLLYSADPTN